MTRGIIGWGTYLPYRRLDRTTINAVAGVGGGRGHRTVASFDEDTTTMGVESARACMRTCPDVAPASIWFSTTVPAYLDKTNATAIHAALRFPSSTGAYDVVGGVHSAIGALRAGLLGSRPSLVVGADIRGGQPGSGDETAGGDGAAALLIGDEVDAPVLAELVSEVSLSEEFLDRWREPGSPRSKLWEERYGERKYVDLGEAGWVAVLKEAGVDSSDISQVVVSGTHERAVGAVRKRLAGEGAGVAADWRGDIGNPGAAEPTLALAAALEEAEPGQLVALLVLADGVDAFIWRATEALARYRPFRSFRNQVRQGALVSYGKFLAWRGWLDVDPPRRPEPNRPSASAAGRTVGWKFGFVGSEREQEVHMPPALLDETERPMADAVGVVATYTIDRLAYSPSPPVVFAVVDFEGGGRLPVEITDLDLDEMSIGLPVEMTFRRLFTADGIHNYFWKARPLRQSGTSPDAQT
jgi:hydroxymethylglutaryl-CoA synthase